MACAIGATLEVSTRSDFEAIRDVPPPDSHARPRAVRLPALAVAAATLALMVATSPRLALAWDEAYTLARLDRVRLWFASVQDPASVAADWNPERLRPLNGPRQVPPAPDQVDTRAELFERRTLEWFWPFAREEPHGHPPFYALVALVGDVLGPGLPELTRVRLGTMLAFSLTAGAIFAAVARRYGPWPGAVAAGAWVVHPHLFALGHYATYDALLSCLWVGAVLAFARAVEPTGSHGTPRERWRWPWVLLFGLLLGCAMGTKLTGWLLPLPLLAWAAIYRDRRGLWVVLVGGAVGLLAAYALTPPWWPDPLGGLTRFFASNLSRQETIRIRTLFLGRVYETPRESLPPYNTLVWTVFVTPVGFLLLAATGAFRAVRRGRSEPFGMLVLIHAAFLLALRAMPHTPGHDGVRQFLPAFGCLAVLSGLGAAATLDRLGRWARPLLAASLVEGAASVALMMPVPLSYYSPLVGGLPGAAKLGMEPTYYWDALSDDALVDLDRRTPPGRAIFFVANPVAWYYRESGRLGAEVYSRPGQVPAWYVLQNRPGAMGDGERALVARLGSDPRYVLARKLGVPLVWAFPAAEVEVPSGRRAPTR